MKYDSLAFFSYDTNVKVGVISSFRTTESVGLLLINIFTFHSYGCWGKISPVSGKDIGPESTPSAGMKAETQVC